MKYYEHLGGYSGLVAAARKTHGPRPIAKPGKKTQKAFVDSLGFNPGPLKPQSVKVERKWSKNGVDGELISWSVGYGPRTEAYVLRPKGEKGPLPGVLAMHDHGGFKYFGKEKIADGPGKTGEAVTWFRKECYESTAFANRLAERGFTVLVPDTFCWGSRKFPMSVMRKTMWNPPAYRFNDRKKNPTSKEVNTYNDVANYHENTVEKYCTLLGTTLSGVINYEDRVAAAYLRARKDVKKGKLGCVGLSGGGMRTVLMQGSCDDIGAAVVVGMMCTYDALYDSSIRSHTWGFFPRGWPALGDWSDIAACRAPSPLMVLYDKDDNLFPMDGMTAAHRRLRKHYKSVGKPGNYVGKFYPGPHKFDVAMQEDAFCWLDKNLRQQK